MRNAYTKLLGLIKGLNLTDLAFLALVLSVMAFYDLRKLAVVIQGVFLLCVASEVLWKKTPLFGNRVRVTYIAWYLVFFLWAALSYLWAEVHDTYIQMLISIAQVSAIGIGIAYYIDSPKRVRYAQQVLGLTALVFCLRFVYHAPPWTWLDVSRIGKTISFGGNRGPVFLSFITLLMVHLALENKRRWLFLPAALFLFISMVFGTRSVLVFSFTGAFFLILARARTWLSLFRQGLVLLGVALVVLLMVFNISVLQHTIGRRVNSIGGTIAQREILSEYDRQLQQAEEQARLAEEAATTAAAATVEGGVLPDSQVQSSIHDTQTLANNQVQPSIPDTQTTANEQAQPGAVLVLEATQEPLPEETPLPEPPIRRRASSANTRLDLIDLATQAFLSAPIQGIGLDNFRFISDPHFTYAHNTQLELLANLGLVGFLLYYSFHFFSVLYAWRHRRDSVAMHWVFAHLSALFITDVFLVSYVSERDHVLLGILIAILCLKGGKTKQGETVFTVNTKEEETEAVI